MSRSEWDLYLAAGDESRAQAAELHRLVTTSPGGSPRVFVRGAEGQPGATAREAARALGSAGVVVLLMSRQSDLDGSVRSELASAVASARTDPNRPFVPVYLDAHAERHKLYGANIVQGIAAHREGLAATAEQLIKLLATLRVRWNTRARVAVVGVAAELGDTMHVVAARLRDSSAVDSSAVSEVDIAAPGALQAAGAADFRLAIVGARLGPAGAFGALLDSGARAIKLAHVDPDLIADEEIRELKQLRRRIEDRDSFTSVDEAAGRAKDLFSDWLKEWAPRQVGASVTPEPWERAWLVARRTRWLAGSHEGLREASRGRSLDRARLYVPLRAVATPWLHVDKDGQMVVESRTAHDVPVKRGRPLRTKGADNKAAGATSLDSEADGADVGELHFAESGRAQGPLLEAALSHPALPHVLIEAEAGAGKTVLLQHIACVLGALHTGEAPPDHALDLAGLTAAAPLLRLPLLVEARRLVDLVIEGTPAELCRALAREVSEAAAQTVTEATIADGLKAGRYLLLIDSLDEVPGLEARARLLAALDAACALRWPFRLVVTSRPTAHTGLSSSSASLRTAHIARLDDDRVAAVVARWSDAMGEDDAYRDQALDAIRQIGDRHGGADVSSLTGNPLLLTCTLIVYDQQRLLPDSPADLYERMVQILCRTRPTSGMRPEAKREALERVCEAMQRAGSTALPVRQAAEVLLAWRADLGTLSAAEELLDRVASDSGLLRFESTRDEFRRHEVRVVRPWHRSFQEFLAACRLAAGQDAVRDETDRLLEPPPIVVAGTGPGERLPIALDPAWEGALGFLVGIYGNQGSDRARGFVERLAEHGMAPAGSTEVRRVGRLLGLAARGIAEYPDLFPDKPLRDTVRHAIADRFAASGADWPLRDRLLALEALGRIGDPRLEGDWWVEIPAGEFTLGDGESANSTKPRRVRVAAFRIAWRPVTVADYRPFVESKDYQRADFWRGVTDSERYLEPENWSAQRYHPNRPVVGVSHHEASAWCRWASEVRGEPISLPTEEEWEYAARGPESSIYPWGTEVPREGEAARANFRWGEGLVGSASPVGAFPGGNRGALVDLAGNVWEWCDNEWSDDGTLSSRLPARGAPRPFRGGSWDDEARFLRCAARSRFHPWDRDEDLGFRVVCRVSRQHA